MTAKEIYESIDLSKLKKDTADKLRGLEKKTKGFTLKSDKVDAQMKKFYDTLKERKPDALKNLKVEVKKVEEKAKKGEEAVVTEVQKVVGKKKVAKKTATPSAPKKRRTVATLAKAIRRKDEPWQSALKRAGEQMKSETKAAESATKTELEKLRKMIKSDPKFSDYPRTYGKQSKAIDMSKDAKTKALPAGKRVSKKGVKNQYGTSKGGRTYWENRDNRSDRNAPNYPTKVYLEYGGSLATQPYWLADNADALVSTETMGEMFEVGGQVFVPTEQLADNANALVSTNTYAELFKKGGKLDITSMFEKGGMVNLYYGGEQEDETLPASSEKDAANIAMRNGAEHYEFVPRMAKGGKVDTSKKGVFLMHLKDGTYKVSVSRGNTPFPHEFADVFPTKARALKFAEKVAENNKTKLYEITYAKGGMVTASRTAMEIGALTGMNKNAIQKFVDDNNLDIERLYKFVLKSGLKQRMDMVSAIAGSPNNPIQKKIIKTFAK